jgi:predicted outer membrane protein
MKTFFLNTVCVLGFALFLTSCSKDLSYNDALNKNKKIEDPELVKDANFLVEAKSVNMLEEQLASLAADTAYSAALVELSKNNIKDYDKLDTEIDKLALKKKIKLPTEISSDHLQLYSEVNKARHEEFDKDLLKTLRKVNDENTEKFESMATEAHDDDIRAFSARYLDMLRSQSERIKVVEDQLLETTDNN